MSEFPHTCPECGGAAYLGLTAVKCSQRSCKHADPDGTPEPGSAEDTWLASVEEAIKNVLANGGPILGPSVPIKWPDIDDAAKAPDPPGASTYPSVLPLAVNMAGLNSDAARSAYYDELVSWFLAG